MANIDLYIQKLTNIADAIRRKLSESNQYTLEQMPGKIDSIPTGGSSVIVSKTITSNGTYDASSDSADGYNPVTVNVPQLVPYIIGKQITANGTYRASSEYADGYDPVIVQVPEPSGSKLINIRQNGNYTENVKNYETASIFVNVPQPSPLLISKDISANGTYKASDEGVTGYNEVIVHVPTSEAPENFGVDFMPYEGTRYPIYILNTRPLYLPYIVGKEHLKSLKKIKLKGSFYGKSSSRNISVDIWAILPAYNESTGKYGLYNGGTGIISTNSSFIAPANVSGYSYRTNFTITGDNTWHSQEVDMTIDMEDYLSKMESGGYKLLPSGAVVSRDSTTGNIGIVNSIMILVMATTTNTSNAAIYMAPPQGGNQLSFIYNED